MASAEDAGQNPSRLQADDDVRRGLQLKPPVMPTKPEASKMARLVTSPSRRVQAR